MNAYVQCPLCNGPQLFESTKCVSFCNHKRKCNTKMIIKNSTSVPNVTVTCLTCNGPRVYESTNCQSYINHKRSCCGNNDKFFTTMIRSQNYDGLSLLQSSKSKFNNNDNLMNDINDRNDYVSDDYIFDSCTANEQSNVIDTYNRENALLHDDEIKKRMLPCSEHIQLQPHALLCVRVRNIISTHGAPVGMYDKIISLVNKIMYSLIT